MLIVLLDYLLPCGCHPLICVCVCLAAGIAARKDYTDKGALLLQLSGTSRDRPPAAAAAVFIALSLYFCEHKGQPVR